MTNSPPKKKPRNRTCTGCGHAGPPDDFAGMTRVCNDCNRERVAKSEGRADKQLDIPDAETLTISSADFESREALSDAMKKNLQTALNRANRLVGFQDRRLDVACKEKDAKLINEASKGLENAQNQHIQLCTKLMEKLQAMEDLRAQAEKAKPVTFYFLSPGQYPVLQPQREVPAEYYPDPERFNDEVDFS